MTYAQLMEEFHCSREVATLGLTTYIFGLGMWTVVRPADIADADTDFALGIGPLFLGPLSEVSQSSHICIVSILTSAVLRSKDHLHRIVYLFRDMAYPVCRRTEHPDHDRGPFLQRSGGQRLSERGGRNGGRLVCSQRAGCADDDLHGQSVCRARTGSSVSRRNIFTGNNH